MELNDALDIIEMKAGNTRYRVLTDPDHPEYHPSAASSAIHLAEILSGVSVSTPLTPPSTTPRPLTFGDVVSNGRIRVGLWCPVLFQGGAEIHQQSLLSTLDSSLVSWQGLVVVGGEAVVNPMMLEPYRGMPVGYGRDAARELARHCDLILSWAIIDVPGILEGVDTPPKVVCVSHAPRESAWGVGVYQDSQGIDRFVCVSELAKGCVPDTHIDSAVVIENAVDESRLVVSRSRAEMHSLWGVPPSAKVAGYLGRLSDEKDVWAMIRAAEALPDPWHVVIVGEGVERPALESYLLDNPNPRCHLQRGDTAIGDVLGAYDCLVVPSHYESFCLAMAEGLVSGVPVISTEVGIAKLYPGLTRLIPHDVSGSELASAILQDHDDVEGTRTRVERAGEYARRQWTRDRYSAEWNSLLRSMFPRRKKTRKKVVTLREMVNACKHRTAVSGCPCDKSKGRCALGYGDDGVVTLADCARCLGKKRNDV